MTAWQWYFVVLGGLAIAAGVVMPLRALATTRGRKLVELTGTPWWLGVTMIPVGACFALAGVLGQTWPVWSGFAVVLGGTALGRRYRREVEDPPPMLVLLDRAPLNPFWGLRRPKEWSAWITDLFRFRRNQREYRTWQERHGLRRGAGPPAP